MIIAIFILLLISVMAFSIYLTVIFKFNPYYNEPEKIKPPYAVISVKNAEDCIEGIIRSIIWQMQTMSASQKNFIDSLVIIDLDSDDETSVILKKISAEYPFVHYMNKNQYIDAVSGL